VEFDMSNPACGLLITGVQFLVGIVRVNSILPADAPRQLELRCFCSRMTDALGRIRRRKSPILICFDRPLDCLAECSENANICASSEVMHKVPGPTGFCFAQSTLR
jgi:hypothetical protein